MMSTTTATTPREKRRRLPPTPFTGTPERNGRKRVQPTGRRRGPRLPPEEKCSKAYLLKLRPEDFEGIKAAARLLGESMAEFVSTAALRRAETAAQTEADAEA
jgi:hypothetical protein